MSGFISRSFLGLFLTLAVVVPVFPDSTGWTERLNKDGIIVWTRKVEGYKLDSYRAQTDLEFPIQMIFDHLTDLSGFIKWVQHIETFEVISEEENRWVFYEIIHPPVGRKRDFVGQITARPPGDDGSAEIVQVAVDGYRPELENHIRITDFHETWKLVKLNDNLTRATLEVLYDPGGNPPALAMNWMAAQGPYESFLTMREALGEKQADSGR